VLHAFGAPRIPLFFELSMPKVLFFIFLMNFGYPFTSCLLGYFLCLIPFTVLTIRRADHPYPAGSLPTQLHFALTKHPLLESLRPKPWSTYPFAHPL
jgi:hypothetical protein